jgi:membrane protein DedA with SNARE-associated domain
MGHLRFLAFTAAGASIWNVLLILGGRWLGRTLAQAEQWFGWVTLVVAVISIAFYIWRVATWKPREE